MAFMGIGQLDLLFVGHDSLDDGFIFLYSLARRVARGRALRYDRHRELFGIKRRSIDVAGIDY